MNTPNLRKTVADIMVREVQTISQNETVTRAAEMFATFGFRHLVVTDDAGQVIGLFSHHDLLKQTIH